MAYTYKQLEELISGMTEEQKGSDVTVYDQEIDEYFQIKGIGYCNDGVLDDDHPFIIFKTEGE